MVRFCTHIQKTVQKTDQQNKVVRQYQDTKAGNRCHTYLLDVYISKVPADVLEKNVFYLCPFKKLSLCSDSPWFTSVPLGKNTLSKMMATMCLNAGIFGHKNNHSLRAYAATELYQA